MSPCRIHDDRHDKHTDEEWDRIYRERFEDPDYYRLPFQERQSAVPSTLRDQAEGRFHVMVARKQDAE